MSTVPLKREGKDTEELHDLDLECHTWRNSGCPPLPIKTPFPTRIPTSSSSFHLPWRLKLMRLKRPLSLIFLEQLLQCFPRLFREGLLMFSKGWGSAWEREMLRRLAPF